MSALIRMRLEAYVRTRVALAPLLAALVVLGIFYGGGQAAPAEAYGLSAVAGLLAAALTSVPTVLAGLALPWLVGGVSLDRSPVSLPAAVLSGLWVHPLAVPSAVALGAVASRALTRSAGNSTAVLVTGFVLAIVLGLKGSPVPWLMPPLMPASREVISGVAAADALMLTGWALAWTAVVLFGYVKLRRSVRP